MYDICHISRSHTSAIALSILLNARFHATTPCTTPASRGQKNVQDQRDSKQDEQYCHAPYKKLDLLDHVIDGRHCILRTMKSATECEHTIGNAFAVNRVCQASS